MKHSKKNTPSSTEKELMTINLPKGHKHSKDSMELLAWYYIERVELAKKLNHKVSVEDYQALFQEEEFQNTCLEMVRKLGIAGWFYGIVDSEANRVHIVKNEQIDPQQKRHPFFYYPIPQESERRKRQELLDLMFEADEEYIKVRLDERQDYKAPYFLQNTPPFSSPHSLPLMPFEKAMRDRKGNFLYCYTGEVLFFSYVYRYLIKIIKCKGFDQIVPIDRYEISNDRESDYQLWDLAEWTKAGFRDIPEVRWLKTISGEAAQSRYVNQPSYKNSVSLWQESIASEEAAKAGQSCDFIGEEWKKLGLHSGGDSGDSDASSPTPPWMRARYSLMSYAVHLLKSVPIHPNFKMAVFDLMEPSYVELMGGIFDAMQDKTTNWHEILKKVIKEETLLIQGQEKKLDKGQNEHWMHYLVLLAAYFALTDGGMAKNPTAKIMLEQLHRRSRFPILQSYFQVAWAEDNYPIEHCYFSLHNSVKYAYKSNLQEKPQDSGLATASTVVMAAVQMSPIWKINPTYNITTKGKHFLFDGKSALSPINKLRLNLAQDFLKLMAAPAVDSFFYGKIIGEATKVDSKFEQHQFQAHEIKDLIYNISPNNPGYVLELIRLYMNVIFGSRASVVRSFIKMNQNGNQSHELPEEFRIDSEKEQIKDVVEKAIKLGGRVQAVTEEEYAVFDEKNHQRFPDKKEDFERLVAEKLLRRIKFKPSDKDSMLNSPLQKEWFQEEEDARGFYFIMAIATGLRNAIEHSKPGSDIEIYEYKLDEALAKRCIIIKNEVRDTHYKAVRKMNMGSTALSLIYYMRVLLELTNPHYRDNKDKLEIPELASIFLTGPTKGEGEKYFYYTRIPDLS